MSTVGANPFGHIDWAHRLVEAAGLPSVWTTSGARARVRHVVLSALGSLVPFPRKPFLRCLHLHYVYDDQPERFRRHLERLRRLGTFVTTEEACAIVSGRRPLERPSFHLSFDDAFENVYKNALPILLELQIPAAVFVPTSIVSHRETRYIPGWRHVMPTRVMDWRQVAELHRNGIEIGSHTRHHVRLSEIASDPQRVVDEIVGSKKDLEDHLGQPCRYISWPFGTRRDIAPSVLQAIERAGYDGCFGAYRAPLVPGVTSRFSIPRHHFEPEWPWPHVRYFAAGGREAA